MEIAIFSGNVRSIATLSGFKSVAKAKLHGYTRAHES